MILPLILNYGLIAVYGIRQVSSIGNITAPQGFNFGTVYQISPYEVERVSVGSKVSFKGENAECILAINNQSLVIIEEAKLVTIGIDLA